MLIEFYIIYQILGILLFLLAYFTKNEVLWAFSALVAGFLMVSSFFIEKTIYLFDTTISAYVTSTMSYSYPFLMGINFIFFGLSVGYGLFDLFEKYGNGGTALPQTKNETR
jgi:hypothetical protein